MDDEMRTGYRKYVKNEAIVNCQVQQLTETRVAGEKLSVVISRSEVSRAHATLKTAAVQSAKICTISVATPAEYRSIDTAFKRMRCTRITLNSKIAASKECKINYLVTGSKISRWKDLRSAGAYQGSRRFRCLEIQRILARLWVRRSTYLQDSC